MGGGWGECFSFTSQKLEQVCIFVKFINQINIQRSPRISDRLKYKAVGGLAPQNSPRFVCKNTSSALAINLSMVAAGFCLVWVGYLCHKYVLHHFKKRRQGSFITKSYTKKNRGNNCIKKYQFAVA